jgi:ABC-type multidrug transport system fused ATPase/permease subunit
LVSYAAGCSGRLVLVLLALGAHSGAMLLFPWLVKNLYHDAAVQQQAASLYPALGLIAGLLFIVNAALFFSDDQLECISLQMIERIRNDLINKLVRLPASHLLPSRTGEAVSRAFNDVEVLKDLVQNFFFTLGSDALRTAGSIVMLFLLSWHLALISLFLALGSALVIAYTSRCVRRRFHQTRAALADMTGLFSEQVRGLQTIQAYGAADYEMRRFAAKNSDYSHKAMLANRIHVGSQAAVNFLGAVILVFLLGLGTREVSWGGSGLGSSLEQLLSFALYAGLLAGPFSRLSRTNGAIQRALAAGRHLFELLDAPEERNQGFRALPAPAQGRLHFDSVSFHYRPGEPVLRDVDLEVSRGEIVAVVGPSGAGKSTLAHLALRFYDPVAGRVLLDGHDIRDLRREELRRQIGWIAQDPFLFFGTIAENIRYGSWTATAEQIQWAARLAGADDFIRELRHGYEARIGERGVDLSGGQRARLALARIILRAPSVLILDEITAPLDTEMEVRLWKGLKEWLAERTTLIISHRLVTVLGCTRAVVIEGGQKRCDGPPEQLRHSCPAFNRIFVDQMNLAPAA